MRVPNPAMAAQVAPVVPPDAELIDRLGLRTVIEGMIATAVAGLSKIEWLPEITAIEGETFSIESCPTMDFQPDSLLLFRIGGELQFWIFEAGTDVTAWAHATAPVGRVTEYGEDYNFVIRKLKTPNFFNL